MKTKKIKTSINKSKCLKKINKSRLKKNFFSNNINCQIVFSNCKNMHIFCKKCKKHTGNTFPKKLILISKK